MTDLEIERARQDRQIEDLVTIGAALFVAAVLAVLVCGMAIG